MSGTRLASHDAQLARHVRERFVAEVEGVFQPLADAALATLGASSKQTSSPRENQDRRDAFFAFQQQHLRWVDGVRRAWRQCLASPDAGAVAGGRAEKAFALIDEEEIETRILASRLSLAVIDKVGWELNNLRLRIQRLENLQELAAHDVFKPETVASVVVEQWMACGLSREIWSLVSDGFRTRLAEHMLPAYHHANEFLIHQGVMPEIDLKPLVKRSTGGATGGPSSTLRASLPPAGEAGRGHGGGSTGFGSSGVSGSGGMGERATSGFGAGHGIAAPVASAMTGPGHEPGHSHLGSPDSRGMTRPAEETRLMTNVTPLARARQRAQGVLGQLRQMLTDRVAGFEATRPMTPSPALAQALCQPETGFAPTQLVDMGYGTRDVAVVSQDLRQRSSELKRKAGTASEKATIEIVALMFQSILAEERIPAGVRVWFARLQMPVLRVALAEPEFFGTLLHPARQLIDRMGSCVLGFDARVIEGGALEAEIRRVVQVIEQYPETGRRVFQLMRDEFQKFLARFLTETAATQRVVSVAQQIEQKEILTIQYTIEVRNLLKTMPVRHEIREFLFKVWAEVLAIAAVRHGDQDPETLALKRTATDLLWAASAKPDRQDRARVIQALPQLLQRLRQGMTLLGLPADRQDAQIKIVSSTLADAFMSKTEVIPQAQLDEMAQQLANLENLASDDGQGDYTLDAATIETLLGMDASSLVVVGAGGSRPSAAMLAWVQELEIGNWFALDHNGQLVQVQYVWRSERKQLHLFASAAGRSYLLQARRLAAYLQAGLLVPAEDETLTVRATREALAKLDANPERLLG